MRKPKGPMRRKMGAIKRGWLQPKKELRKRLAWGITVEAVRELTKKIKGFEKYPEGAKRENFMMRARRDSSVKQNRLIYRVSAKYALDALGITDKKTRARVQSAIKESVELLVMDAAGGAESGRPTSSILMRHVEKQISEALGFLGERKKNLFLRRFVKVAGLLIKEIRGAHKELDAALSAGRAGSKV